MGEESVTTVDPRGIMGWDEARKNLRMSDEGEAIADNAQQLAAWLIRTNYVKEVGKLCPAQWVAMTEAQLTKLLAEQIGESRLKEMFLEKYELRQALKGSARRFSLAAAAAIALIWAAKDLDSGDYGMAGLKFSATVGGTYALNSYFYGRDKSAAQLMARAMGQYGKWFQGVARTNPFVNFLTRRVLPGLLIWDLRGFLMSSGSPDGPNIPFDFIIYIDLFDRSTWQSPPATGLDLGFDYFYYHRSRDVADLPLGVIRGSLLRAPKRWLDGTFDEAGRSFRGWAGAMQRFRRPGPWGGW